MIPSPQTTASRRPRTSAGARNPADPLALDETAFTDTEDDAVGGGIRLGHHDAWRDDGANDAGGDRGGSGRAHRPSREDGDDAAEPAKDEADRTAPEEEEALDDGLKAPFARNPTHGLVPLRSTEVYKDRLKGWTDVVRRLVVHFEVLLDQEKRLAESYTRSVKDLANPVRVRDNEIFDGDETMQVFFRKIFESYDQRSSQHQQAVSTIETQTLPTLRALLAEIRKKVSGTDREWATLDRDLARDRDTYLKLTTQLKAALERQKWASQSNLDLSSSGQTDGKPEGPEPPRDVPLKDPWLANMLVKRFLSAQLAKQAATREAVLDQQRNIQVFEQVVIQHIRDVLSTWYSSRSRAMQADREAFGLLSAALESVDPRTDWRLFRERRRDLIIDPDDPTAVADLDEKDVPYEGRDDPKTLAIKEDVLWRNMPGVLRNRGHMPGLYVLTAAGHLHGFHPPGGLPGVPAGGPNGPGGAARASEDGKDAGGAPPLPSPTSRAGSGAAPDSAISAAAASPPPPPQPAGELPTAAQLVMEQDPDVSLCLADATVQGPRSDPREPDEFAVAERAGGGFLNRAGRLRLKARSADESEFWCDLIASVSRPPVARRASAAVTVATAPAAADAPTAKRMSLISPTGSPPPPGSGVGGILGLSRRPSSPSTAAAAAAGGPAGRGSARRPPARHSSILTLRSSTASSANAGTVGAEEVLFHGPEEPAMSDNDERRAARAAGGLGGGGLFGGTDVGPRPGPSGAAAGAAAAPAKPPWARGSGFGEDDDDGLTKNAWDDGAAAAWGS
ncbi:hypothetical protein HK405_004962 [Cladochytrium tenue]|nr:hypothetical protein HK405_004962 [Cladochytrium tenue]